jgi:16S rRNA (cytosine1402-N4)-methyltransferase
LPSAGELAVDCTLGYGGHAAELLAALQPGGRLIGLDVDPIELPKTEARLRALGFGPDTFTAIRTNYAGLARTLTEPADVIFADLGLSSMQLDNPRVVSPISTMGPLDLRMNPQRGQTASALLATLDESGLAALLHENADEPNAERLAHAILQTRDDNDATCHGHPPRWRDDDAVRRAFQALRIAVNDEFGALEAFLQSLPLCLKAGGRVAILTFHSGEDRRVKKSFQSGKRDGTYSEISDDVVRATSEELRANPRSRSAKLRWARRSATNPWSKLVIDNQKLAVTLRSFAAERDWISSIRPKNLATSISVEAAELLELFQCVARTKRLG